MSQKKFLLEALKFAEKSKSMGEVPVGAVLVHEDQVIGEGYNLRETNLDPLGHAELMAIRLGSQRLQSWRLLNCVLYVTLEPCPMCLSACQQARVAKVVYGAKDPKGGAICLGFHVHDDRRLNHRFEAIYEPVDECSQILKDFFRERREENEEKKK